VIKIQFSGRVFPLSVQVTLKLPVIDWKDEELGLKMQFDGTIEKGMAHITCLTNKLENDYQMVAIYNRAFDILRTGIDLVSFGTGRPWTLVIEQYVDANGGDHAFGLNEPGLGPLCRAVTHDQFNHIFGLLIGEPPLFYALHDLIESIRLPRRPIVNCTRVIETLRVQMSGGGRGKGWPELQNNLQISQAYLKFITAQSRGHRHGDWDVLPSSVAQEAVRRTWVIFDRFLEFRKRGNTPLDASEFPLLT
jgi:hypothetical protein